MAACVGIGGPFTETFVTTVKCHNQDNDCPKDPPPSTRICLWSPVCVVALVDQGALLYLRLLIGGVLDFRSPRFDSDWLAYGLHVISHLDYEEAGAARALQQRRAIRLSDVEFPLHLEDNHVEEAILNQNGGTDNYAAVSKHHLIRDGDVCLEPRSCFTCIPDDLSLRIYHYHEHSPFMIIVKMELVGQDEVGPEHTIQEPAHE